MKYLTLLMFIFIFLSSTSISFANTYDVRICNFKKTHQQTIIDNENTEIECMGSKKTIKEMYRTGWVIKMIVPGFVSGGNNQAVDFTYSIVFEKRLN